MLPVRERGKDTSPEVQGQRYSRVGKNAYEASLASVGKTDTLVAYVENNS
jgi:hypothetical protein